MNKRITPTGSAIAISALVKGEERYIILYDDANRDAACQQVGRWAGNPANGSHLIFTKGTRND